MGREAKAVRSGAGPPPASGLPSVLCWLCLLALPVSHNQGNHCEVGGRLRGVHRGGLGRGGVRRTRVGKGEILKTPN